MLFCCRYDLEQQLAQHVASVHPALRQRFVSPQALLQDRSLSKPVVCSISTLESLPLELLQYARLVQSKSGAQQLELVEFDIPGVSNLDCMWWVHFLQSLLPYNRLLMCAYAGVRKPHLFYKHQHLNHGPSESSSRSHYRKAADRTEP